MVACETLLCRPRGGARWQRVLAGSGLVAVSHCISVRVSIVRCRGLDYVEHRHWGECPRPVRVAYLFLTNERAHA
jgi:hypothetical protein